MYPENSHFPPLIINQTEFITQFVYYSTVGSTWRFSWRSPNPCVYREIIHQVSQDYKSISCCPHRVLITHKTQQHKTQTAFPFSQFTVLEYICICWPIGSCTVPNLTSLLSIIISLLVYPYTLKYSSNSFITHLCIPLQHIFFVKEGDQTYHRVQMDHFFKETHNDKLEGCSSPTLCNKTGHFTLPELEDVFTFWNSEGYV